ncbi:hypothetical protein L7F22_025095, partial [Adiantum nelumboides]|nr:hypothetical protein [Adiantum nelumboides]
MLAAQTWDSCISELLKCHRQIDALAAYQKFPKDNLVWLSGRTFVSLLSACKHFTESEIGIEIHEHVS